MSAAANDLIEAAEQAAGQRFDDPAGMGFAAVVGMLLAEMGRAPIVKHHPETSVAAGLITLYQMSSQGQQAQAGRDMLTQMLAGGMSPETIRSLVGGK